MPVSPSIALQLYSLRNPMAEDSAATLARIAETGYQQIELYNIVEWRESLREGLAANGLAAPTAHARLTEGGREEIFEAAAELGVETLIDPFVEPTRWTTRDDVLRIADELREAEQQAGGYGLKLGYHNHFWETENVFDGTTALEAFAGALPGSFALEVDVYWSIIGGADPVALLGALGSRVQFLHVKDAPLVDGSLSKDREDQLPAGQGAIDWPAVLEAAPSARLLVVEFDEYRGDIFDGIAQGLAGARALIAG
jgi:sugar phosphate isomerase/epimerase